MYILLVYERELSKNDYLRPLLITVIKSIEIEIVIVIMIIIRRRSTKSKYDIALINHTMFLKVIFFNQNMYRMKHHPLSVVYNEK